MECRKDGTFSTTGIERITDEERSEILSAVMQDQKEKITDYWTTVKEHPVANILAVLIFFGLVGSMVYFASQNDPLTAVTIFGSVFVISPIISLFSEDGRAQSKAGFMILATGLGVVIPCFLKRYVAGFGHTNIVVTVFIAEFAFWGIIMIISAFSKFGLVGRSYKDSVMGDCIGYQYFFESNNSNSGYGDGMAHQTRTLVAAPVYTYNYEGVNYTQYDKDGGSSFTTVTVGERRELFVDTTDPTYFKEKSTKGARIVYLIFGVLLLGAALFAWHFSTAGDEIRDTHMEDVEIVKVDGKIVLTQEYLMSENRARIDYDNSILHVMRYVFIALAAGSLIGIAVAISFCLKGKKEDISDKAISNRLLLIFAGGFVFLLSIGMIFAANGSLKQEQERYDSPVYLVKEKIVEKSFVRGTNDNDPDEYRLITEDGDIYSVPQIDYDSVEYVDYYYIARTEIGDAYCGVYYCEDYVAENNK